MAPKGAREVFVYFSMVRLRCHIGSMQRKKTTKVKIGLKPTGGESVKEARPADGKQEEWPDISHDLETRRAMKKASAKPDPGYSPDWRVSAESCHLFPGSWWKQFFNACLKKELERTGQPNAVEVRSLGPEPEERNHGSILRGLKLVGRMWRWRKPRQFAMDYLHNVQLSALAPMFGRNK